MIKIIGAGLAGAEAAWQCARRGIDVKMSMTAPGCGMGNVLKADVENKLLRLPDVTAVGVEIVFEPAWGPGRMSEAAKLQLGFDLDYGSESPSFPMMR